MTVTDDGWANKVGTGAKDCTCGSWSDHWLQFSGLPWPARCAVRDCGARPTVGAHIYNDAVPGVWIAPMCASCNALFYSFSLKPETQLVSANPATTCER